MERSSRSSKQRGPFLRTQEGEESATLCNFEGEAESDTTAGPDFEIVSPTAHSSHSDFADAEAKVEDAEGTTQVVFSREGVAVWPTPKRSITGTVSLVKQGLVLFFQWLPSRHAAGEENRRGEDEEQHDQACSSPVSQGQYAVHPLPISEVKAIQKQTPKLGAHHIVLIQTNGLTLGPFHFRSGGVRALFSCLKQHVVLSKSGTDASTYLINDLESPLQRSLATLDPSLDLQDVLMIDPSHLATLPYTQGLQSCQGAETLQGALLGRMREGMQRASQFARDSFMQPPRQQQHSGTALDVCEKRKREDNAVTGVGCFEMVDRSESESMQSGAEQPCPPPLTQDEWFVFMDAAGRVVDEKGLRMRIFKSGVEAGIRKEVWKYLLGLYPPGKTAAHRHALMVQRREEYDSIKAQWTSISECQAKRNSKWRERWSRIDKDVRRSDSGHPFFAGRDNQNPEVLRRILLSYTLYNYDLGYCQGMSDLAAPILFIMQDEAQAFWCFAAFMERMEANFSTDSTSMQAQLEALRKLVEAADPELSAFLEARDSSIYLVTYRWLLVHFKREFSFDEVLRLWEGIWSCPLTPHFPIYLCVAILQLHRQAILACGPTFDDLLSFCVLLSGKIDLAKSMRRAEKIVLALGETGAACLKDL